ncbi:MAG: cell division protein FtsK [Candidatus Kerfeldbacteria bacterium CG08_land_8_20_14_0_20_40_16]|uniref:Cell division protein FtsK n=1 Tax=Candidatus Kerfeldbacteria bacterium CG08_land_8_20_14_0_20_40_16 TaxID=2014244 RepID=A0A2H0YW66_9BACT|nr:MAG: cell division protein FtsK [Candidatus Kerfeldbacteria bacterium CG08_land_8_20_14_0_20_40_16]
MNREKTARQIAKEKISKDEQTLLNPETRRGIIIVLLFLVAILSILSFFDLAGSVGEFLKNILLVVFGWGAYLFPIILIAIGYLLIFPEKYSIKLSNYLGIFLLYLSFSGILHLFISQDKAVSAIGEGRGGGYFGLVVSLPLLKIMGIWATAVVLIALLFISLLIVFSTSLNRIIESGGVVGSILKKPKEFLLKLKEALSRSHKEEPTTVEESDRQLFNAKEVSTSPVLKESVSESSRSTAKKEEQLTIFPGKKKRTKIDIPLDLLEGSSTTPTSGDIKMNREKIERTLANFGIEVEMGETNVGPTVTQYTLKPAEGVKLSQIVTLQNDIALALAAHPIRIEAPIPGKSLVGIEVPNQKVAIVKLKEILESDSFKERKSDLTIALGKDVGGKAWTADLDAMPHLLIAGATGSGKSVCINTIIVSLLYQNSPDNLKFILIDPKRVEFTVYNGVPHLLTPVITEVDKTINALKWIVGEMDRRFRLLSEGGKRDIRSFNGELKERLPYIVVVIDELADLMSIATVQVETAIIRLAQMARAVGIHLVVATQRPSVDVITGLIKANITSRVAFTVASSIDSRTILDFSGSEKLLGRGDMLYVSAELSKPKRLQGAYVTEKEIERIVNFLKEKGKPEYQEEIITKQSSLGEAGNEFEAEEDETLLTEAKDVILKAQKASASFLQRRLRIGYARAARILDILEKRGIIGPGEGAKPREVYLQEGEESENNDGKDSYPEEDSNEDELLN